MKGTYFVGVDSGSQSTKVSLIDLKGAVVASAAQPLRPMIHRQTGWVEHPDDDLWDSLKAALRKLFASFDGRPEDIVGLGLCSIRCCRVFLKAEGTLAAPVMSWMDTRAYRTYEDEEGIAYTGSTSGYLTFRLTGEFRDTAANAYQYQFPVDMDTWKWSEDPSHFDSFKIPREKLFDIGLPGDILGLVSAEAAAETGLPAGLPVVATANDKAVEALGSGLIDSDTGLLSLGTYITSMVMGSEVRAASENLWTNLSSIPRRYLYESGGIRGGMWHISWFKNVLGESFAAMAEKDGKIAEQVLEAEAAAVPPGSDGLLILPDWLAPATDLWKKGAMIGFDQRHGRAHIYRALMEGIALRMKNHFDAMNAELGVAPRTLIVCGGGSNSDLFMQIVADVFGVRATRNVVNGAAAVGSAICAAVATGAYANCEAAVAAMVRVRDAFDPIEENRLRYARANEGAYRNLPRMLEDSLKTIAAAVNPAP